MSTSSVISVSRPVAGANYKSLTWENSVSEDQGLPIAHASDIALTSTFVVGGAW
jgi:hypothetical protein